MHYKGKLRSYNTSYRYCLIEVVTKAGLTVYHNEDFLQPIYREGS